MSEHQKNRRAHNEAADEAKLEDEALNEVQGGVFGPGSCDPSLDRLNNPLKPEEKKSDNAWEDFIRETEKR